MDTRDLVARTVHADAWEQHGRLRADRGGATGEAPGIRLMASGLPHPQWNNGDVTDPAAVDLAAVRDWYAPLGVPWGVRVPAGAPWPHGTFLFRKHLVLRDAGPVATAPVPGLRVRPAGPGDLATVVAVSAAAFDGDPALESAWIEPHLHAPGRVTVALAVLDGTPVATGYVLRCDGRAGPAAYLSGIAVLSNATALPDVPVLPHVPAPPDIAALPDVAAPRDVAAPPDVPVPLVWAAVAGWLLRRAFDGGARVALAHPDDATEGACLAALGLAPAAALDVYVDLA